MNLAQLLVDLFDEVPTIVDDTKKLFEDVSTGHGGLGKLVKAASTFSDLAAHVSGLAHGVVQQGISEMPQTMHDPSSLGMPNVVVSSPPAPPASPAPPAEPPRDTGVASSPAASEPTPTA